MIRVGVRFHRPYRLRQCVKETFRIANAGNCMYSLRLKIGQFADSTDITDIKAYAKEDRRFHNFVTEVGAKEFLKSILQTYNIISASYLFLSSEGLVRPPDNTIHEHLEVIKAIRQRDPDTAEELMRQHLKRSIASLKQDIEKEC